MWGRTGNACLNCTPGVENLLGILSRGDVGDLAELPFPREDSCSGDSWGAIGKMQNPPVWGHDQS